jgi:membrane protease YdiL (CAAX protease family)
VNEAPRGRPWNVFATFLAAVAAILVTNALALAALLGLYPDVPETTLVQTLPALLAGVLASSSGLLFTLLVAVRPLDPARLRLRPGWETGPTLTVMVLGLLGLGQALESAANVLGFGDRGTLALIRQMLERTRGPELFAAVLVIGFAAGTAEEIFFRGYMQARLREHWSAPAAVLATSASFALMHADPSAVHVVLAFVLGIYLGFVAEISGSTLPSIVCHVVNNVAATLQIAFGLEPVSRDAHLTTVVVGVALVVVSVVWVRRAAPRPAPG